MGIERVTYRSNGGNTRSVYLDNVRDSTFLGVPAIVGDEVDQEGTLVDPPRADLVKAGATTGSRVHVIEVAAIKRRQPMVVDYQYGHLVPDGDASQQQPEWICQHRHADA